MTAVAMFRAVAVYVRAIRATEGAGLAGLGWAAADGVGHARSCFVPRGATFGQRPPKTWWWAAQKMNSSGIAISQNPCSARPMKLPSARLLTWPRPRVQ